MIIIKIGRKKKREQNVRADSSACFYKKKRVPCALSKRKAIKGVGQVCDNLGVFSSLIQYLRVHF